jgi:hypothetical protein
LLSRFFFDLPFRLEPEFEIPMKGPAAFLPKFVGAGPHFGMTHHLAQLLSEFFRKFSKSLHSRPITGERSSPRCDVDLMLYFSLLIHTTPQKKHGPAS